MTNCPRCGFKLDEIDVKRNVCPVCEKILDPKQKREGKQVRAEDERA
jgi:uncharacterized Zn finger protein (UPF0148 family)